MKVLYFAFEYYCNYGARTHARSFFHALSHHPLITKATIFPTDEDNLAVGNADDCPSHRHTNCRINVFLLSIARMIWRLFIPKFIRKQITLYYPSPKIYQALVSEIKREGHDAIVLRIGEFFRFMERLRNDFPQMKICIEFNATSFDESLEWIPGRELWRREEARQLCYADSISVVSQYLRNYLITLNPSLGDIAFVNPNGVDTDIFKPLDATTRSAVRMELGIPTDAVVFGYIGGMESFRRLPQVVAQFAALRRSGLDRMFLVLIGTGQDIEEVLHTIDKESSDLTDWVYCSSSWVQHERVPSLMAAFDVGFFPFSNPYVSPLKIFEYLSCALPVIGPDIPGVSDMFDKNCLPFLIRQDGSNFEQVVHYVYDNLKSCRIMAQCGRVLVEREYTWHENASKIVKAIAT